MSAELAERVALVTGGSRGIGQGIALELARAGAALVFTYRTSPEGARETCKRIEEAGGSARAVSCDVADLAAVEACVAEVLQTEGRLDIAVSNAGVVDDQIIARMKPEQFDAVVGTNLRGTWNLCKAVIRPFMRARYGRIVNLSSVVVGMGNPGQTNYAASKGGIEALTRSLAHEVGSRGITVNAVAPGFVETDMTRELSEDVASLLRARIPLGRLGSVEDVARAVRFLASEDAAYITGQVIHVNGGLY